MVFVSACIQGRQVPRATRVAAVFGLLAIIAVAATPATAQQSPQTGVQAPSTAPATGTPPASGAAPAPRQPSGGDGHCSSKTPVA